MHLLFSLATSAVAPFWILLVFAPSWKGTQWLVRTRAPVIALAAVYAGAILPHVAELLPLLARPELGPIRQLLGTDEGTTLIWIHVLAFDLLAAIAIYEDDRKSKRSPWLTGANLAVTLLFGPLGYVIHQIKRKALS